MRIGVLRETVPGERRVALVPDAVAKLVAAGHQIAVQRGAGEAAGFLDAAYEKAGATLAADAAALCSGGPEIVVKVRKPSSAEAATRPTSRAVIGCQSSARQSRPARRKPARLSTGRTGEPRETQPGRPAEGG